MKAMWRRMSIKWPRRRQRDESHKARGSQLNGAVQDEGDGRRRGQNEAHQEESKDGQPRDVTAHGTLDDRQQVWKRVCEEASKLATDELARIADSAMRAVPVFGKYLAEVFQRLRAAIEKITTLKAELELWSRECKLYERVFSFMLSYDVDQKGVDIGLCQMLDEASSKLRTLLSLVEHVLLFDEGTTTHPILLGLRADVLASARVWLWAPLLRKAKEAVDNDLKLCERLLHYDNSLKLSHVLHSIEEPSLNKEPLGNGLCAFVCRNSREERGCVEENKDDEKPVLALDREIHAVSPACSPAPLDDPGAEQIFEETPINLEKAREIAKDLLVLVGCPSAACQTTKQIDILDIEECPRLLCEFADRTHHRLGVVMINSNDGKAEELKDSVEELARVHNLKTPEFVVWHGSVDQLSVTNFTEGFMKSRKTQMLGKSHTWNFRFAFLLGLKHLGARLDSEQHEVMYKTVTPRSKKMDEVRAMYEQWSEPMRIHFHLKATRAREALQEMHNLQQIVAHARSAFPMTKVSLADTVCFELTIPCVNDTADIYAKAQDLVKRCLEGTCPHARVEIYGVRPGSVVCTCFSQGIDVFESLVVGASISGISIKPLFYGIDTRSLHQIRAHAKLSAFVCSRLLEQSQTPCDFFDGVWWLFTPAIPLTFGNIHSLARIRAICGKDSDFKPSMRDQTISRIIGEYKALLTPHHVQLRSDAFQRRLTDLEAAVRAHLDANGNLREFSVERWIAAKRQRRIARLPPGFEIKEDHADGSDSKRRIVAYIASGTFGDVYEVEVENDNMREAMKMVTLTDRATGLPLPDEERVKRLAPHVREAHLMLSIGHHPNLVNIHAANQIGNDFFFFEDLVPGGMTLRTVLTRNTT